MGPRRGNADRVAVGARRPHDGDPRARRTMANLEPVPPQLQLIARFRATLAEPLELGQTPWGRRRVIGITGGEFDGPLLSGKVLPGGADWQIVHEDGTATIDTRYTLECHDGALISVATRGAATARARCSSGSPGASPSILPSTTSACRFSTRHRLRGTSG